MITIKHIRNVTFVKLKLLTIQFQELQKKYENLQSKLVQPEVAEDPDQVELQEWLKVINAQIDEKYRTQYEQNLKVMQEEQ